MGISHERIAELHPVLYHMAEYGTWDSIKQHGLLSTSALLDLFKKTGEEREIIESRRRSRSMSIYHTKFGTVVIRDQRPMSDSKLAKCLRDGLTTSEWYRMLNHKVFFWLTEPRLATLMKAYAHSDHVVLEVDTRELLRRFGASVLLAPMNTGTTTPMAFPRGRATFQPPNKYRFEANKRKKGGAKKAIVELTVNYSVKSISEFTVRATHRKFENGGTKIIETLFVR